VCVGVFHLVIFYFTQLQLLVGSVLSACLSVAVFVWCFVCGCSVFGWCVCDVSVCGCSVCVCVCVWLLSVWLLSGSYVCV
jgi:hypothetical protein